MCRTGYMEGFSAVLRYVTRESENTLRSVQEALDVWQIVQVSVSVAVTGLKPRSMLGEVEEAVRGAAAGVSTSPDAG